MSEESQSELEETKNQLLRALADFDNYKKRSAIDREQFINFANESLIVDILPILDGFVRAMEHAPDEVTKGIALVKKQLEDVLKKHGVAEIEALGKPYNPNLHEAILNKEDSGPEGVILEEVQKGYALRGRVIRPSMVIVSKTRHGGQEGGK